VLIFPPLFTAWDSVAVFYHVKHFISGLLFLARQGRKETKKLYCAFLFVERPPTPVQFRRVAFVLSIRRDGQKTLKGFYAAR
jgi:hypothetical protein